MFVISVILLALGVFITVPLLDFMVTNLRANTTYEDKMDRIYACDAGVEHAINKIVEALPPIPDLVDDGQNDSDSYTLSSINGYPVLVTIKKTPLVLDLLGSDEYKTGQPHEDWINFSLPLEFERNPKDNFVSYNCTVNFNFTGSGNRQIEDVGVFFLSYPGSPELILPPEDVVTTGAMTLDFLESFETKITSGGFAFIWRWQKGKGPIFDSNSKPPKRSGSLDYTLKVLDANWTIKKYYAFATIKSEDISYVTNMEMSKWLISAKAGGTQVKAQVVTQGGIASISAWQLDPLQ